MKQSKTNSKPIWKESFQSWIKKREEEDGKLDPEIRKRKWVIILSFLLIIFLSSFLWTPILDFHNRTLRSPHTLQDNQSIEKQPSKSFEMPVDSFEMQLKQNIYERPNTK